MLCCVTSRIGTTGMPANRSVRACKQTHKIASSYELLGLYWFVMVHRGRWVLLILGFFLPVFLPWISASVTDTVLFALVTSWLSSDPVSRVIFSPWPLTPVSLSSKTIKPYSLILPVSHARVLLPNTLFSCASASGICGCKLSKNRLYSKAVNPSHWKVQLWGIHGVGDLIWDPLAEGDLQWYPICQESALTCMLVWDVVFSIVLLTLLYNFEDRYVELRLRPGIQCLGKKAFQQNLKDQVLKPTWFVVKATHINPYSYSRHT